MPVTIYGFHRSPPVCAVLLTAKVIGLEVELKSVDVFQGENRTDEFLKMNPAHTVPTMADDGLYLSESRAIMMYLVQKYGKDDTLYPNDLKKRAVVDNMLYFDASALAASFITHYLNPCGKVPVLDDNGFVMWESRAINAYLVDKYGTPSNSSLYPSDRHKRAIVDIMLHFDNGTLSNCIVEYFNPIAFFGQPPEPRRGVAVDENLGILDRILTTRKFVAGNEVTIADFSIISAITTLQAANYNFDAFPHLNQWIQDFMQAVPFYDDVTGKGVKQMYAMAKEKLAQLNKK